MAYPRPMVQGAEVGDTNGLAGSRTDQMIMPYPGQYIFQLMGSRQTVATYQEAADEELNEEQIAVVGLVRAGE